MGDVGGVGDHGPRLLAAVAGSPVAGPWQSIDGAELFAVLLALRFFTPPVTMYIDASFVVDGLLARGRGRTTSATSAWGHLWAEVWRAPDDFGGLGPAGLTVHKLQGHATLGDVANRVCTARQRRGNVEADYWAKRIGRPWILPDGDRRRHHQASLVLDGVAHWVGRAGALAGAAGADSTLDYRRPGAMPKVQLSLSPSTSSRPTTMAVHGALVA